MRFHLAIMPVDTLLLLFLKAGTSIACSIVPHPAWQEQALSPGKRLVANSHSSTSISGEEALPAMLSAGLFLE